MKRRLFFLTLAILLGGVEVALGVSVLRTNPLLGGFLIFVGLGYCLGGGIYLAFERPGGRTTPLADRSMLALLPGALVILFVPALEYHWATGPIPRATAVAIAGMTLILAGMALRVWVRVSLRRSYTATLQVQAGQRLETGGPYRWVRHPGYFSFVLQAAGIGLGLSSMIGLLATVLLLVPGLAYRIRIEERMLVEEFGQAYQEYSARTRWKLIPWVW